MFRSHRLLISRTLHVMGSCLLGAGMLLGSMPASFAQETAASETAASETTATEAAPDTNTTTSDAKVAEQIEPAKPVGQFEASRLTIEGRGLALDDVLKQVEQQTGNTLIDGREQFGEQAAARTLSLQIRDEPFWPAVDSILDQASLGPYEFSGKEGLMLVNLPPGATARRSRGSYEGPFRIEATQVSALRSFVTPSENRLSVTLALEWEPRLKPLAISQTAATIEAVGGDDQPIAIATPEAIYNVEAPSDSYSTEFVLPFELPERKLKRLKHLTGELRVFAPGAQAEFKFTDLNAAAGEKREQGDVTVTFDRIVENNGVWEIHMRLRLEKVTEGLDAFGEWIYRNITVLEDSQGNEIDHAGFEKTGQTKDEIGFAYLFELEDDIANYNWIYRTPVDIQMKGVKYRLKNLPLP